MPELWRRRIGQLQGDTVKFTIEVTSDTGRFSARCLELGIVADAIYVENALRDCTRDIMTALHKGGGEPQEAYERLVNMKRAAIAAPIHYGCVYPAGQECRGKDRCLFPSQCVRNTETP
jgi:hypothetical protein